MSQHFATDYERVTIHLYRADGTVHTMDLVSGVEPLVTQIVTRGHDVERWNGGLYVERELIATTARVELSGTIAKPRPVEGSTPEDQLIDEVIADASPGSTPLDSPAPGAVYDVSPAEVERCYLSGEHEPHDYYVDAPAGEWRHCDGAAPAGEVVSPQQLDALGMSELMEMLRTGKTSRDVLVEALGEKVVAATEAAYRAAGEVDTFPDTPGAGWGSSDIASAWTVTKGTGADFTTPPPDMRSRRQGGRGPVAQAGEPAPVPPPVDALEKILNLVEEVALARVKAHAAANRDDGPRAQQHSNRAKALRLAIAVAVEGVRAAGVEEGRRQGVRRLAQGTDEHMAYVRDRAYERGVAEGRRQATEERTEVERG